MLSASIVNDEIKTTGAVEVGDVYLGVCCAGWGWEVRITLNDGGAGSVWGQCDNPACSEPKACCTPRCAVCVYSGVTALLVEELAERLATAAEMV